MSTLPPPPCVFLIDKYAAAMRENTFVGFYRRI